MRLALTAVLVAGLSAVSAAQSSIGLPLPHIGLPLPQIGLPLPRIGLPPIGLPPAADIQHRGTNAGRPAPTVIYFIPASGWGYPGSARFPGTSSGREQQEPPTGRLRLELQPGVVPQVYVDGYYVGTLDDVNGELALDAGPHTLDLRADGYESLELDVQILAGRVITYRGALKASDAASMAVAQVPEPTEVPPPATIYVIPGCYVGNVPPKDAGLPAGCDATRAIAFESLRY